MTEKILKEHLDPRNKFIDVDKVKKQSIKVE